tara:strand:+ start:291 stop:482 length:192 start_codon:yes stop_codon:yes gene_type:complete
MDAVRYGAGGVPMVNQPTKKVEPVAKTAKTKKKQEALQEILEVNPNEDDGFDEEVTGEENEDV